MSTEQSAFYDPEFIKDDIHGYVEIPRRIKQIIDTPHFQRLRELKQLGVSYHVYLGASHNRFEHSLGVMHLATKLLEHLMKRQPELQIDEDMCFCVQAAGLLHDLGHGPFSHVFDVEFMPLIENDESTNGTIGTDDDDRKNQNSGKKKNSEKFRHEDMSIKLIEHLFSSNKIEIETEHLQLIQALISPKSPQSVHIEKKYRQMRKGFIFEIIANEESGVDVDKWDYIYRDSKNCRMNTSFTYDRLLAHARVINDHICYHEKTSYALMLLFHSRYTLFKTVYTHKTTKAIEYMVCDILRLANDVFKISDDVNDLEKYLRLNDSIINRIRCFDTERTDQKYPADVLVKVAEAQHIIKRILCRDLYSCAAYLLLAPECIASFSKIMAENLNRFSTPPPSGKSEPVEENKTLNNTQLKNMARDEIYQIIIQNAQCKKEIRDPSELKLKRDDIIIQITSIGYGHNNVHPIENVWMYNSSSPNECRLLRDRSQVTRVFGADVEEVIFRIFTKQNEFEQHCIDAFYEFAGNYGFTNHTADLMNSSGTKPSGVSPLVKTPTERRTRTRTFTNRDSN